MTLCGRWRCWDRDGEPPVGRMNLCGSYNGKYSIRGGGVGVHTNKRQCLILEKFLTEAWNPTTS